MPLLVAISIAEITNTLELKSNVIESPSEIDELLKENIQAHDIYLKKYKQDTNIPVRSIIMPGGYFVVTCNECRYHCHKKVPT